MSEDCILVIDAGTTGCRSVAFSKEGEVIASAYSEFPSSYPQPDRVEQRAEDWWNAICYTTKQVMEDLPGGYNIAALTVTNQRETVVSVDRQGKPLRPALVWQDRRSVKECAWLEENIGAEEIYKITGLIVDPYFTAPKLLWLKNREPEIFNSAQNFLLVHDYIIYKLTGRAVTEPSNASRTMLFDLIDRRWSSTMLDLLGIPGSKLPDVLPSGSFAAELTTGASNETLLPEGTHVFTGGGDQQCAALGCGVTARGRVKATTGTGTFMLAYSEQPRQDPERRVLCSAHVVPDAYVVEASIFTTGAAYKWLRDNFAMDLKGGNRDPYEVLDEEAESSEPGARGITFIPHLAGAGAPHWNPRATGIIKGLSLGHTRGDLVRAMMEGVAVELRKNLEVMRSMGLDITELRLAGGGARSNLWNQITADMCGLTALRAATEDATALGGAVLAAAGAKIHNSIEEAEKAMVQKGDEIEPDKNLKDIYLEVFERSVLLYDKIN